MDVQEILDRIDHRMKVLGDKTRSRKLTAEQKRGASLQIRELRKLRDWINKGEQQA